MSSVVGGHDVCEPHIRADPVQVLDVLTGRPVVLLDAEALLVERFAQMRVQPDPTGPRDLRGTLHQGGDHREREQGAAAICSMESGDPSCHLLIASSVAASATDGGDPGALHHQVAGPVLGASGVDCRNGASGDDGDGAAGSGHC